MELILVLLIAWNFYCDVTYFVNLLSVIPSGLGLVILLEYQIERLSKVLYFKIHSCGM